MIIGVMSDTHGNTLMMLAAAAEMVQTHHAEAIWHLGDDYADAVLLERSQYDVRKVPGLWCPEYRNTRIEKVISETIEGATVVAAHADKDLRAQHRAADVILTGHTHVPQVVVLGRALYVNPGHLKSSVSRGQAASYAVVEIGPETIRADLYYVSGTEPFESAELKRP